MVKSMTGYGRGEAVLHERTITVEVRSVNNRYLDCSIKMPRLYVFAEDAIKTRVQTSISRGKVDVFVSIDSSKADSVSVSVNRPVADGYYAALTELRDAYGLRDDLSVSLLSRFQDVLLVEKAQEDVENSEFTASVGGGAVTADDAVLIYSFYLGEIDSLTAHN